MGRGRLRTRYLTRSVGKALVRVQQLLILWLLVQLQLLMHQLEVLGWDLRLRDAVQRARRGRHRLWGRHSLGWQLRCLICRAKLSLLMCGKLIRIWSDFTQVIRPRAVSLRIGLISIISAGVCISGRLRLNFDALMLDLVDQRRALIP